MSNKIPINLTSNLDISQPKQALEDLKSSLNNITFSDKISSKFSKSIESLSTNIEKFEDKRSKASTPQQQAEVLKIAGQITKQWDNLQAKIKSFGAISDEELLKLFPKEISESIRDANKELAKYNTELRKLNKQEALAKERRSTKEDERSTLSSQLTAYALLQDKSNKAARERRQLNIDYLSSGNEEFIAQKEATLKSPKSSSSYREAIKKREEYQKKIADFDQTILDYEEAKKVREEISKTKEKIVSISNEISRIKNILGSIQKNKDTLTENLSSNVSDILGIDKSKVGTDATGVKDAIDSLKSDYVSSGSDLGNLTDTINQSKEAFNKFGDEVAESKEDLRNFNSEAHKQDAIKSQISNFLGAVGAVQLFRRTLSNAFKTIKELDSIMTEAAVVTKYTVSEMWDKLPEYTERANKLGTTTASAYKSVTLFLQQGLKTSQAIGVANESLKMARIAGLDAVDATDKLTSAMRGFNMEINEASAQRVNDVYSKLAAITASNTQEISSAMTKAASIAHSAGMEFELASAYLAQGIETTREPAENLGTALKTVIARFQELKKAPSEIGEVEGEVVDANKIETALRSVGITLRDESGQFRDLGQVFLELNEKWDSLDKNTQRYIATVAAGSRRDKYCPLHSAA